MKQPLRPRLLPCLTACLLLIAGLLCAAGPVRAQHLLDRLTADSPLNLLSNGGFEASKPAYWEPSGAGATWSREQARTPAYSLKLSGSGAAQWQQPEAVRNWTPGFPGAGNPELVVGAWVYTEGVNTNPTSDDEKFQLLFEFFDENGTDLLGGPVVLDLPQQTASTGAWVELSSETLGAITLPGEQAAKSARITFRKGAAATGTAYLDDVFIRKADPNADGWTGDFFNANVDAGDTWYYWWNNFSAGEATWPATQPHLQYVTDEEAHSGSHSLLIAANGDNQLETVAISERVPVSPGEPVLLSFWVRHEGHPAPEAIGTGQNNLGLTVLWYNNLEGGAAGWGEIGGVDIVMNEEGNPHLIPLLAREASTGWTQYAYVAYPPEGAVGLEARLRYWHQFQGNTFWDDVFIAPVKDVIPALADLNLLSNGGFEASKPAYWEPSGAGATWSREQARTPAYSLKLSGSGAAQWQQPEAVRNWTPGFPGAGNPELVVGAWVYTEGVNTNPTSDDEKFQLLFEFFDENGTDLLGGPVVLDLPQQTASTGAWVELSSETLGAITLPGEQAAKSARITFRKGAAATGTAYLDDVFIRKADPNADGWTGDFFNANVDAGDTWYYWWNNFSAGEATWPATQPHLQYVTDEEAHSGSHSLLIAANGDNQLETVAISERVPVSPGEPVLLSFWVRHEGHPAPEAIGTGQNNLGLTVLWYNNLEGGAAGWGEIGGVDIVMNEEGNPHLIPLLAREASTGWTQYAYVAYPPEGAVGLEARLRYWHQFQGNTLWDDVAIIPLGGSTLVETGTEDEIAGGGVPETFRLLQNYPNPFNRTTTIAFDLTKQARVTLTVYNLLGQRVAVPVDDRPLPAGRQQVTFDAAHLPSGVYLYVLDVEGRRQGRQMVLLK
ncbi:MAG: hypothetical protein KatS3mg043_1607 [Rhodothermaceae bacterium]|nr:MAG: hypothetical protein KatS3mg043_1607 [Rhodothermaceae bacterium]